MPDPSQVQTPSFFSFIFNQWTHRFFQECENIATNAPHMDSEELEALAAERTSYYFYIKLKERLEFEMRVISWRHDLV